MKKQFIASLFLMAGVVTASAQGLVSKKGENYLPEKGDFAISLDASPFLTYAGNMLSSAGSNLAPTFQNYGANQTIVGKYFTADKTAIRGIVRVGMTSMSAKNEIGKASATPQVYPAASYVTDKASMRSTFIGLGVGIEKRKGNTRLQGYYGADAYLWMGGSHNKYEYGNALSSTDNPSVTSTTSTDWSTVNSTFGSNITADTYGNPARKTESKSGSMMGIGLRAFVGAEYFIFPKMSLGGEFGWGVGFYTQGKSTNTVQSISGTTVGSQTNKGGGGSGIMINTDRNAVNSVNYNFTPSGTLRMNLYF